MEPEYSKDEWQAQLRDSWILVAIVALILVLVIWAPFRHRTTLDQYPELRGIERNLRIEEIIQRLEERGAGRLFPPRGFGALAPHQATDGTAPAAGMDTGAAPATEADSGTPAPAEDETTTAPTE